MRRTLVMILALVIAVAFYALVYSCDRNRCERSGGTVENVRGGRGGWVCVHDNEERR